MTKRFDSEKETRVLLEEVRFELKVVAEGHTSVVGCLDKIEGRLDKVEGELHGVQLKLVQHDERFDRMDQRFDRLEGQLSVFQHQVGSVLKDHEQRFTTLEGK